MIGDHLRPTVGAPEPGSEHQAAHSLRVPDRGTHRDGRAERESDNAELRGSRPDRLGDQCIGERIEVQHSAVGGIVGADHSVVLGQHRDQRPEIGRYTAARTMREHDRGAGAGTCGRE